MPGTDRTQRGNDGLVVPTLRNRTEVVEDQMSQLSQIRYELAAVRGHRGDCRAGALFCAEDDLTGRNAFRRVNFAES